LALFYLERKKERKVKEMKTKEYLINLLNKIKFDETGQYSWSSPGPNSLLTAWRKNVVAPVFAKTGYNQPPTYTYKGGGGSVSPQYTTPAPAYTYKGGGGSVSPQYIPPAYTPQQQQPGTPVTTATTPATSQIPALSAALGYSYQPYSMPAYNVPQYQVNLPQIDWSFDPSVGLAGRQAQATATAAQEINPQLQAIQAALDQYLAQGQVQRAELNPRYTNQSLAIANIIKNTVKQEAIDQAIRRNATESGWLPSALMGAGELETQQRGDVEAQRNQDLAALAALETQQTQAASAQSTMLEGLRGQRITTALAELENQAWARSQQEKQNIWQSALGGEQLRASAYGDYAQGMLGGYQTQAGVGMSNADRALQAAIAAAEQGNVQWQQQYTTSQDAYQQQLEAAIRTQANVKKTPLGYEQGIPYYSVGELDTIRRTYGLGPYAPEKTQSNTLSNMQDLYAMYMTNYSDTGNAESLRKANEQMRKIEEYTYGPYKTQ